MAGKHEKATSCGFRTSIGGQALIEGILMRGPKKQAIVCRTEEGLTEKVEDLHLLREKYPFFGWPLVRGCVTFIDSMVKGMQALMYSASLVPLEEQEEPDKIDKWITEHFPAEKAEKLIIYVAVVLGIALSVFLFIFLPTFIVSAIMTPPDIISQIAMALPSWLLFEISLLFARAALRKKKAKEEAEEAERQQEEAAEASTMTVPQLPEESSQPAPEGAVAAAATPAVIPNPVYHDPAEDTPSYEEFMDDEQYSDSPEDIYAYQQTSVDQSPTEKQVRIRNLTPARHFRKRGGRK